MTRRLAVGSDDKTPLTDWLVTNLRERGFDVTPAGALADDGDDYVRIAEEVADRVARGQVDEGILCCWTGTGVSLVANKVPGIRAALCADAETARGARIWNHANVLALSLRLTTPAVAGEILDAWFGTAPGAETDVDYAGQIRAVEERHRDR